MHILNFVRILFPLYYERSVFYSDMRLNTAVICREKAIVMERIISYFDVEHIYRLVPETASDKCFDRSMLLKTKRTMLPQHALLCGVARCVHNMVNVADLVNC